MSVVIFVNRMMSGVIALSYQSMSQAMTPGGSFYFFAALSAISVAFYYFMVGFRLLVSVFLTCHIGNRPEAWPTDTIYKSLCEGGSVF